MLSTSDSNFIFMINSECVKIPSKENAVSRLFRHERNMVKYYKLSLELFLENTLSISDQNRRCAFNFQEDGASKSIDRTKL